MNIDTYLDRFGHAHFGEPHFRRAGRCCRCGSEREVSSVMVRNYAYLAKGEITGQRWSSSSGAASWARWAAHFAMWHHVVPVGGD